MLTQTDLSQQDLTRHNMVQWQAIKLFHVNLSSYLNQLWMRQENLVSISVALFTKKSHWLIGHSIAEHKTHLTVTASGPVKAKKNRKQVLKDFLWMDKHTGSLEEFKDEVFKRYFLIRSKTLIHSGNKQHYCVLVRDT